MQKNFNGKIQNVRLFAALGGRPCDLQSAVQTAQQQQQQQQQQNSNVNSFTAVCMNDGSTVQSATAALQLMLNNARKSAKLLSTFITVLGTIFLFVERLQPVFFLHVCKVWAFDAKDRALAHCPVHPQLATHRLIGTMAIASTTGASTREIEDPSPIKAMDDLVMEDPSAVEAALIITIYEG